MANILNTSKTIGTTSQVVLPDRTGLNSSRKAFILTNTSVAANVITIAIGEDAVAGQGIVLYPGGSIDMTIQDLPPQTSINAISDLANATLAVYEESE